MLTSGGDGHMRMWNPVTFELEVANPGVQRSSHQEARQWQHPCKVMSSELMQGYELSDHARL